MREQSRGSMSLRTDDWRRPGINSWCWSRRSERGITQLNLAIREIIRYLRTYRLTVIYKSNSYIVNKKGFHIKVNHVEQ